MSLGHGYVRLMTKSDHGLVDQIRQKHLRNEGSFSAQSQAIEWSTSDDNSLVLGIFSSSGALLSTMRAELIFSPEGLVPKLDYDELHNYIDLPCGLLGKAVTEKEYQGHGFNTYLRYLSFLYFIEKNIRFVVGTVMPQATRVNLLKNLKYQFLENSKGWHRYGYQSAGPTLVCYLDLQKNSEHVIETLKPLVAKNLEQFPLRLA